MTNGGGNLARYNEAYSELKGGLKLGYVLGYGHCEDPEDFCYPKGLGLEDVVLLLHKMLSVNGGGVVRRLAFDQRTMVSLNHNQIQEISHQKNKEAMVLD